MAETVGEARSGAERRGGRRSRLGTNTALYARLVASRIHARMQYRTSLVMETTGAFLISFLDFVEILIIFRHMPHMAGWSLEEVAFLYGSSYIAFKAADVVFGNLDRLPEMIRTGELDQILTRPVSSLGQVLARDIDIRHIGGTLQGAAVFWVAVARIDIAWTAPKLVALVSMITGGFVIFGAVWIATNTVSFWTTDGREVANSFTYGGNFLTQHPLDIYATWLRRLVIFAVPLAFVNYFPAQYILDRPGAGRAAFASWLVAAAVSVAAVYIWRFAVRHYRSTGS